jgi:hypothetical protein
VSVWNNSPADPLNAHEAQGVPVVMDLPPWIPTQVYERLWMGGVPDEDTMYVQRAEGVVWRPSAHRDLVDAVVTLAAGDGPVGTGVRELRIGFVDTDSGVPCKEHVAEAVATALKWHGRGLRVLIRCRAGVNRSGMVTALVMCRLTGSASEDIVSDLRDKRPPRVLSNTTFVELVHEWSRDVEFWGLVNSF